MDTRREARGGAAERLLPQPPWPDDLVKGVDYPDEAAAPSWYHDLPPVALDRLPINAAVDWGYPRLNPIGDPTFCGRLTPRSVWAPFIRLMEWVYNIEILLDQAFDVGWILEEPGVRLAWLTKGQEDLLQSDPSKAGLRWPAVYCLELFALHGPVPLEPEFDGRARWRALFAWNAPEDWSLDTDIVRFDGDADLFARHVERTWANDPEWPQFGRLKDFRGGG